MKGQMGRTTSESSRSEWSWSVQSGKNWEV